MENKRKKMESEKKKPGAIVLTNGYLAKPDAKTAHGLIRGTERFSILAVIDPEFAGQDAGTVLDGKHRNIPVFDTVATAITEVHDIDYCIIGVATVGGILPESFLPILFVCQNIAKPDNPIAIIPDEIQKSKLISSAITSAIFVAAVLIIIIADQK